MGPMGPDSIEMSTFCLISRVWPYCYVFFNSRLNKRLDLLLRYINGQVLYLPLATYTVSKLNLMVEFKFPVITIKGYRGAVDVR